MMNKFGLTVVSSVLALSCLLSSHSFAAVNDSMSSGSMTKTDMSSDSSMKSKGTIVDVAMSDPNLSTFVAALKAADLVSTLKGGSFTVFAPNNAAFDKLPSGTLQDLLKPENKDKLKAILLYHVVPSSMVAADVKSGSVKTVNGKQIEVTASSSGVTINNAKVVKTDLIGSNGVIHVIDTVLMPK